MSIAIGDSIPPATLGILGPNGPEKITTQEVFPGKKVVLFALPGAFTPTCSKAHLPGFLVYHDEIMAAGVDTIACVAVNDAWVMNAWSKDQQVGDKILMQADGNGDFTQKVGLGIDRSESFMGWRSQRYAMIVDDGVVTHLNVEVAPKFEVSDAQTILSLLTEQA